MTRKEKLRKQRREEREFVLQMQFKLEQSYRVNIYGRRVPPKPTLDQQEERMH